MRRETNPMRELFNGVGVVIVILVLILTYGL